MKKIQKNIEKYRKIKMQQKQKNIEYTKKIKNTVFER